MTETGETVRGGFHAVTGLLLFAMAGWNAMTWAETRKRRHGINAALYLAATGYEVYNTHRHWTATSDAVTATAYDGMAVVA